MEEIIIGLAIFLGVIIFSLVAMAVVAWIVFENAKQHMKKHRVEPDHRNYTVGIDPFEVEYARMPTKQMNAWKKFYLDRERDMLLKTIDG